MVCRALCLLALIAVIGLVQCQRGFRPGQTVADGCYGKVMDLFFILDSSTSIYVNDFRREQKFVRDIVRQLDISPSATRVGYLTFSDEIQRPPVSLSRARSLQEAIANVNDENLPYRTGVTNTDFAIRYVREDQEFRQDITKVMVVITDGGSRSRGSTAREATLAKEAGFYMFVTGIGTYLDEMEWRSIASDPDDSFIYNITSFRLLDNVATSLPSRMCNLPPIILGGSCGAESTTDLYFLSTPTGTQDAFQYIDYFISSTADSQGRLRVSYLLEACQNAQGLGVGDDINSYCDRFQRGETTRQTYMNLLLQLRNRIRMASERSSRFAYQAAVFFVDSEAMRFSSFSITNEIQSIEQSTGVRIVVVDLRARTFGDGLDRISSSTEVVRTGGSPSTQSKKAFLDAVCRAINRFNQPSIPDN